VSENDNSQCVATTKVAAKVMGRNAWKGKRVWTWHIGTKNMRQQQVRPDCRQWTAVYDGQSATVRKQIEGVSGPRNRPCKLTRGSSSSARYDGAVV